MTLSDLVRDLPKNARVLDAGCGIGKTLWSLVKNRPDLKLSAIDISDVSNKLPESVHFQVASVEDIGTLFKENEFDAIICQHVIEHLIFPTKLMEGFKKVLKSNALAYIETPNWIRAYLPFYPRLWFWSDYTHVRIFSKETMRRLMHDFDFEILTMKLFSSSKVTSLKSIFGPLIPDMFFVIAKNKK
jgi:2-polyprenyl-3-methyl-5-hydroxy-6-metoxy-1,4-benzoquinol methylase